MFESDDIFQGTCESNALSVDFIESYKKIRSLFFSRNPDLWPALDNERFKQVIEFRKKYFNANDKLANYPDGDELYKSLMSQEFVPENFSAPGIESETLMTFVASLTKDWENPSSVENVASMPSDPALHGSMIGLLANPNLLHREYSEMAEELESMVVRRMANLVGYNPENCAGFFTQGGTFCNLYGYLLGIRNSLPNAKNYGMGFTHDYRIINSQSGHYSNTTNLSLLGVDI